MGGTSTKIFKAALTAMYYSGAGTLLAPMTRGIGVIFTLHNVHPEPPRSFEPNRILKVTPEFLEAVIGAVKDAGFDIVSLDEAARRIEGEGHDAPFACFTLDDGYRDNRDFAYPVFKRHGVPFTIYVPTDYADGQGDLWWLTFERALRQANEITVTIRGEAQHFDLSTDAAKEAAFDTIYWWLRSLPEREARAEVQRMAEAAGFDPSSLCTDLVMSWDEIRALAEDPLVTIGAHTCGHWALAKLPEAEARDEMVRSIQRIEAELGRPCRHFSYPYGDAESAGEREFGLARELGMRTAVTTEKSLVHAHHAGALSSLPRLSLNGDYQDLRLVKVLISGAPFAILNAAKRALKPRAA